MSSDNIIYMDDLPFNLDAQETEVLMKKLPEAISSLGVQHGFNDTVFRDNLMEYVVKKVLNFKDVDEYYASEVFKRYKEKGELLDNAILIGDVKRYKIKFNCVFYDKELKEMPPHKGNFESVSSNYDVVKKNAFFELAKLVFKAGYVVKKLEIVEIEEMNNETKQ